MDPERDVSLGEEYGRRYCTAIYRKVPAQRFRGSTMIDK